MTTLRIPKFVPVLCVALVAAWPMSSVRAASVPVGPPHMAQPQDAMTISPHPPPSLTRLIRQWQAEFSYVRLQAYASPQWSHDETLPHRVKDDFGCVMQIQLLHEIGAMRLHR